MTSDPRATSNEAVEQVAMAIHRKRNELGLGAGADWEHEPQRIHHIYLETAKAAIAALEATRPKDEADIVAEKFQAHRDGYRAAMETIRQAEPADVIQRLQAMGRVSASIYGPLIDQACALLATRPKDELVEALAWYGEQARLARLIHSEGDAGRTALASDGGQRARDALAALSPATGGQE